jgi:hypothetical protein
MIVVLVVVWFDGGDGGRGGGGGGGGGGVGVGGDGGGGVCNVMQPGTAALPDAMSRLLARRAAARQSGQA